MQETCYLCDAIIFPGWPCLQINIYYICLDCIRKEFFDYYTPFDLPFLIECNGLLRYSPKAKGRRYAMPKKIQLKIYKRDKFMCKNCNIDKNLTVDHIKPVSKGGTDQLKNLQTLCRNCNSKKGAKYG